MPARQPVVAAHLPSAPTPPAGIPRARSRAEVRKPATNAEIDAIFPPSVRRGASEAEPQRGYSEVSAGGRRAHEDFDWTTRPR